MDNLEALGFKNSQEFNRLVSCVDISTEGNLENFKRWQDSDGSKAGLLTLPINMVTKKTWEEFRSSKLLWFVNRSLHIFGWAICVELDENGNINDAYPARVKFRGFDEKSEAEGFLGLSKYLEENITEIRKETEL